LLSKFKFRDQNNIKENKNLMPSLMWPRGRKADQRKRLVLCLSSWGIGRLLKVISFSSRWSMVYGHQGYNAYDGERR